MDEFGEKLEALIKTEKGRVHREALSLLFTEHQIMILAKKLAGKELSKTEREKWSRDLKKRWNAIVDLHDLALLVRDK